MKAADFFLEPEENHFSNPIAPELDENLVTALRAGPLDSVAGVSAAIGLLDLVYDRLSRFGTDGSQPLIAPQIELAINTSAAVTRLAAVSVQLPFRRDPAYGGLGVRGVDGRLDDLLKR